MNKESRERFELLVEMDPRDLTDADIKFLRARRDYLSAVQRELFGEVLSLSDDERILSKSQMKRLKELQKETELQAKRELELEAKRKAEREKTVKKLNGQPVEDDTNVEDDADLEPKDGDVEVMTSDGDSEEVKPLPKVSKKK